MLSYLWYVLRLTFQIGGPITAGATMQIEGYDDFEIDEMEHYIARKQIIHWVDLFREAPPSHLHPDGLKLLQEQLKDVLVPSCSQIHDLKTLFGKHRASRWLNSKLEDILWHMDRFGVEPENLS